MLGKAVLVLSVNNIECFCFQIKAITFWLVFPKFDFIVLNLNCFCAVKNLNFNKIRNLENLELKLKNRCECNYLKNLVT